MASYKGYTSAWITRKGRWEIYDQYHQCVYTSLKYDVDPLHDWVDNWSPEALEEPDSPEIGAFKDIDDVGDVFTNRTRGFFSSVIDSAKGFFKKGKAPSDEDERASRRSSTLPPGEYVPADTIDDFSLDTFGYGNKYKPKPADSAFRKMGPEQIHLPRYNPKTFNYGEVVNVLDLETVGTDTTKGSILSYAAMKVAHNLDTGNWDLVSKRTRYYYPTKEDKLLKDERGVPVYESSIAVSGLTEENITARRSMQAAKYGKHFNEKALKGLLKYLGNDPVLGQNISQFDWPKLFGAHIAPGGRLPNGALPPGGLIDILHIAEGTRGRYPGANNLSKLYTLAYGRTPEQDGFTAHDALEDIQITMKVFQAMTKDDSRMGEVSRYVLHHKGLSTQFRDTMIKGITEIRGMTPEQLDILNNITNYGEHEPLIEDIAATTFSGNQNAVTGGVASLQSMGVDTNGLTQQLQELSSTISRLTAAMESSNKTGLASSQVVREAAGLGTVDQRKEYLHNVLGLTGDYTADEWSNKKTAAGYALSRANAIYKARHGGALEESAPPVDMRERAAWYNSNSRKYRDSEWYGQSSWRLMKSGHLGGTGHLDKWQDALWSPISGSDPLLKLTGAAEATTGALTTMTKKIGDVTDVYDYLFRTHQKADKEVYGAASYFIPGPLKEAGLRYFNAYQAFEKATHLGVSKWGHLIGDVGGHGNFLKGIGSFVGQGIMQHAADNVSRIDLWSGFTELLLAPLKLAGAGLKHLHRHAMNLGRAFLNIIANMRNLGLPLTHLTGVTYSAMQRSYAGDAMIGAQNGTMNSAYNNFAGAQQDLYTLGQMDTTRVIAAAMTGTFGDVYATGGDTQAQYAATANRIAAQIKATKDPRERQRLMNLASKIDSTLPTTIQQMTNLGITDYRTIQSGAWLKGTGITQYTSTDAQRAQYTRVGMEYTALTESISDTKNVVATKLWNFIGRDIMSAVNDIFRMLSEGNWKSAIETAKSKAKEFWGRITTAIFGKEVSLGDVWAKVKGSLGNGLVDLMGWVLPKIAPFIQKYVELVGMGWAKIIRISGNAIDALVERLKWLKLSVVKGEDGSYHIGVKNLSPTSKRAADSSIYLGSQGMGIHPAKTSGFWTNKTVADIERMYNNEGLEDDFLETHPYYYMGADAEYHAATSINEILDHGRTIARMEEYGNLPMPGTSQYRNSYRVANGTGIMEKGSLARMTDAAAGIVEEQARTAGRELYNTLTKDIPAQLQQYKTGNPMNLTFNLGDDKGSVSVSGNIDSVSATGEAKAKLNVLGNYIGIGVSGQIQNIGTEVAQ